MAIEPIKGFYVHDEVTDTDGVAKYDYYSLESAPSAEEIANSYMVELNPIKLSNGGLNADGTLTNQLFYVSSNTPLNFPFPVKITNPIPDYNILVRKKKDDGITYDSTGFITDAPFDTVPANTDFLVQIRKNDGSFSKRNIAEFAEQVKVSTKFSVDILDNSLSKGNELATGWYLRKGSLAAGSGSTAGGYAEYTPKRMCTPYMQYTENELTLKIKDGFKMSYHLYTEEGVNYFDAGWLLGTAKIPSNSYYKVMIAIDGDESSIDYLDVADAYKAVTKIIDVKSSKSSMDNIVLQANRERYVVHAGLNGENTIEAFENAGQAGAYACETDIRETSDGVLVCMHDSSVDRTTDGTGNVIDMTYEQIRELAVNGSSHPVPTLGEYLAICNKYGMYPSPEIKSITHYNTLKSELMKYGQYYRCVILASPYNASAIRATLDYPLIMFVYQYDETVEPTTYKSAVKSVENSGVDLDHRAITENVVSSFHAEDVPVWCFTVNDDTEKERCWLAGVDGVTTDTI